MTGERAMHINRGAPTPPIAFAEEEGAVGDRLATTRVDVPAGVVERLRGVCAEVSDDPAVTAETSRDWWPLTMHWARANLVAARAAVLVVPATAGEVADVLRVCGEARLPVTATAGRSGVCGGSLPVFGGVLLDLTALAGIVDVDRESMLLDVRAGTFGDVLEDELSTSHGVTVGHWPQSVALSTVGGWLACRGAGQYSTRYGKVEDMVVGLDVVLADGTTIVTGGAPRAAVGPDLTQVFVGSEGTLGIITGARLRLHEVPGAERRAAFGFASFAAGLDACRRILQRGATPAVLRLYDTVEGQRNFETGDLHPLLVLDEGDPVVVDAMMQIVEEECAGSGGEVLDDALVGRWLAHRNDVSALQPLVERGYVVDTMEIAAPWAALPRIYERAVAAITAVEGTIVASAHQSHSYPDGACLYFTFGGQPPGATGAIEAGSSLDAIETVDRYYAAVWDAGQRAVLAEGGALSHHHGVGLNRGRFVREALGDGFAVLAGLKQVLDPHGILNPGKFGLPSPFGEVPWP